MNQENQYEKWLVYKPMWYNWARQMARTDYSIEDWQQQSYEIFSQALKTYKEEAGIGFSGYYRMLLYRWGKHYLKKQRAYLLTTQEQIDLFLTNEKDEKVNIEKAYEDKVLHKCIVEQMKMLNKKEQVAIYMFYIEGKSLKTISSLLGIKYKTLETMKARALTKLRKQIK